MEMTFNIKPVKFPMTCIVCGLKSFLCRIFETELFYGFGINQNILDFLE